MRRLALALTLLSCPAGAQTAADPGAVACHAFTPDAEYVDTTVVRQLEGGEVTLRVPAQYFEDFWDRMGGYRDTAQLFRVEIGSFEPVSRRETGERNKQGIWNWMEFVASDVVSLELEGVIAADLSASADTPLSTYPPRPGPHELTWLATPSASDTLQPYHDVFVSPAPPAALETVIGCSSSLDPSIRFPVCTQHFRAAGLDTRVTYRRTELAHWREFQAQVTAFLTCATTDPA
jgi:hypothetical protein